MSDKFLTIGGKLMEIGDKLAVKPQEQQYILTYTGMEYVYVNDVLLESDPYTLKNNDTIVAIANIGTRGGCFVVNGVQYPVDSIISLNNTNIDLGIITGSRLTQSQIEIHFTIS